jgi:hypothetical protein
LKQSVPWVTGNPGDRSITGFRHRHGSAQGPMSRNHYYKLKDAGRAPRETEVDGVIMILPEDEAAWERMMANPGGTEQQLIAKAQEMRHRRSLKAGAASAAGSKHVSKQGKRRRNR